MDLGTKIKEALHSPESKDASRGDVDYKTPGSFPVSDVPTPVDTTERNKLHKSNDPRGWTTDDKTPRGHGYSDSGVGLTDFHESTAAEPQGEYTTSNPQTETRGFDQDSTMDKTGLGSDAGAAGFTSIASQEAGGETMNPEMTEDPAQGMGTTEGTHLSTQDDAEPAIDMEQHPYWGDLPRGMGVYNTVAGHGSAEDDLSRHQAIHSGETQTQPITSGLGATASTEPSRDTYAAQSSTNTTNLYDTPTQQNFDDQRFDDQKFDNQKLDDQKVSHHKEEALAGAAAAGAAGVGAYEYGKHKDAKQQELGQEQQPTSTQTETGKEPKDSKDSKLFGLFHRGSKSDDKSKDDTKAKEPKPEKESHSKGLFTRSHDDKKQATPYEGETAGQYERGTDKSVAADSDIRDQPSKIEDDRWMAAPAVALAGAGGMTTYAMMKDRDDENPQTETTPADTSGFQQTSSKPTTGYDTMATQRDNAAPTRSYGTTSGTSGDQYNTLTSGTPSGVRAGDSEVPETAPSFQSSDMAAERQPEPSHDASRYAAGATGAAAGLGAGALAYREMKKDNQTDDSKDYTSKDTEYPQTSSYAPDQEPMPNTMATEIPRSSGSLGSTDTTSRPTDSSKGLMSGTDDLPKDAPASRANEGQYNMLSSGTPSGVKIEDDQATKSSSAIPSNTLGDTQDSHRDTMAEAGLGAAAVGATGLAASRMDSNKPEEEEKVPETEKMAEPEAWDKSADRDLAQETQPETKDTMLGGVKPESNKVIHRCQKCGEENDISSYFTN